MLNEFFYGKSNEGAYSGAIAFGGTSGLFVYPFTSGTGFGTRYASPNTSPATGVTFNSDGSVIAVGNSVFPYVHAYKWTLATGFGTKYANPSSSNRPADTLYDVRFNPDDTAIASAGLRDTDVTSLRGWTWDPVTGFGTKYADPSTLPGATTQEVAFSPDGNDIAVVGNGSNDEQRLRTYPFNSGTGYGTVYASPSTLLTTNGNSVKFSPDGNAIAAACNTGLFAYPWVSGTGYGAQYTTPITVPAGIEALCFSPDGTEIASTGAASSPITVHQWIPGTGFGTKYADPATPPTGKSRDCAFSPTGTEIAIAHENSPYFSVYRWIPGTGFGTKYADPSTLPTNTMTRVSFYP